MRALLTRYRTEILLCLGLVLLTAIPYAQVLGPDFQFVNFDDPGYVANKKEVTQGLTLANFEWAMLALENSNWHPLTWLSLMLDYDLYGLDPRGYHLTNLLLHASN